MRRVWRTPAIVAASVALHAIVLGYMAFEMIGEPRRYGEPSIIADSATPRLPIMVRLHPRPAFSGLAARTRRTISLPPSTRSLLDDDALPTGTPDAESTRTSPAPGLARAAETAVAGAVEAPWRIRSETLAGRIARGGRTGTAGCASPNLLTAQERSVCDERFGERAALADEVGSASNAEREEAFDRQARANDAWRAYTRGEGAYPGLRSLFRDR